MIKECKDHIISTLVSTGLDEKLVFPTEQIKSAFRILPSAAILEVKEKLEKHRRRVKYENDIQAKTRTWRYQVFKRLITIPVVIAAKKEADVEVIYTTFLANLGTRILDGDGNAILISCGDAEGIIDESLLQGKEGKILDVHFEGGVYRDEIVPIYSANQFVFETEMEV